MKKRYLTGLALGMVMCAGMVISTGMTADAKTTGIIREDGSNVYYTDGGGAFSVNLEGMTGEEREKWENAWRIHMKEGLAYLEPYGVTYDEEKDEIRCEGETVRWVIDERKNGDYYREYYTFRTSDGTVDLYTQRDEKGGLTGVQKSTAEEFEQRTKEDEELGRCERADGVAAESAAEVQTAENDIVTQDQEAECVKDSGRAAAGDIEIAEEASTAADFGMTEEEKERVREKTKMYGAAGIEKNKNGSWLWEGKEIFLLLDDDGSLYQNGSEEAKENRICIYVARDKEGRVTEARQVTPEESLKKMAGE